MIDERKGKLMKEKTTHVIGTLLKSVREYKKLTILTPLFVSLEVVLECIIPYVMAKLIDSMNTGDMRIIGMYSAILIALALCSLFCGTASARCGATASAGFAKNLRQDLFFKVQDLSFADIDLFSTSSLVTRLTTDVTNVQNSFQMVIRIAVRTPLMLIFSVIMCLTVNSRMALIYLAILPVLAVSLLAIASSVHKIFTRIFKEYDAMNDSVQENVAGIRVVKAFVREEYEKKKFGKASEDVRRDFVHADSILALNSPIMMFCIYVSMLLVSWFGASLIISSRETEMTTGELSSVISYGVQILSAMMMLSFMFVMAAMAIESCERIAKVINHESTLRSPENGITQVPDGSVSFRNVSFKYGEKANKNALEDINIEIKSGQTVGIIGSTGSSKTTLIQLISRLYDCTEGEVLVGGHNVKDYDLVSLRDAVAVVLQKNVVFSGTIKENMRWGNKNATDEEIIHACKLAQADEFISAMPDKYDTYIERGGTNVSGGQKQRLCIARALLKKPRIIILDDSTSAVDTKTDALIRQAFAKEIPDTTKIIIAQRTSSVENADMILVLDGGRIAEQGTHEELIARGGIYSEVYYSQTRKEA